MVKNSFSIILLLLAAVALCKPGECQKPGSAKKIIKSRSDSVAYVVGAGIGRNLLENMNRDSLDLPVNLLVKGFEDALKRIDTVVFNGSQKEAIMISFQTEMQNRQIQKSTLAAKPYKEEAAKFHKENGRKEGVVTTPSGLQYKVIKAGNGARPKVTDKVTVNYEGRLINGKIFDSSYDRNQPATLVLSNVIPGWQEGLSVMNEGSVFELFIPSDLAYGDQGYPPDIPGGSTLIFKVELIKVEPGDTPDQPHE
jgi:FKBP-type peptidyl-prolyl cis-trans isomerase